MFITTCALSGCSCTTTRPHLVVETRGLFHGLWICPDHIMVEGAIVTRYGKTLFAGRTHSAEGVSAKEEEGFNKKVGGWYDVYLEACQRAKVPPLIHLEDILFVHPDHMALIGAARFDGPDDVSRSGATDKIIQTITAGEAHLGSPADVRKMQAKTTIAGDMLRAQEKQEEGLELEKSFNNSYDILFVGSMIERFPADIECYDAVKEFFEIAEKLAKLGRSGGFLIRNGVAERIIAFATWIENILRDPGSPKHEALKKIMDEIHQPPPRAEAIINASEALKAAERTERAGHFNTSCDDYFEAVSKGVEQRELRRKLLDLARQLVAEPMHLSDETRRNASKLGIYPEDEAPDSL